MVSRAINREKVPKYPTGISKIDELIWGFHPGQVCTVAARPGDGKSSFAAQCYWHLAKLGHNVLFISLEMTKEELVERLFYHEMRVDNQMIRRGFADKIEKEMLEFSKLLRDVPAYFIDAVGYSIEEIEKVITKCNPKPVAVFLDYLQLIRSGNNSKRNYEIGQYLRDFRKIAKKEQFCLISLAQINRVAQERTNKRPLVSDLKDSGDIEQDSDTVLLLYWNCNNEREDNLGKFEVRVGKQRYGSVGTATIRFEPEHYNFSSL